MDKLGIGEKSLLSNRSLRPQQCTAHLHVQAAAWTNANLGNAWRRTKAHLAESDSHGIRAPARI